MQRSTKNAMSSKKRKVFSDLTNAQYNLIPATTLRKLVYNPKSSCSVLHDPNPRPDRSSRSLTSVGSTNVASSTVALNPIDSTGNKRSKNAEYSRRKQKPENSNKENETPDVNAGQKRDDKVKAIVEGPNTPHDRVHRKQRETSDHWKGIVDPFKVDVGTIHDRLFADLGINQASSSNKHLATKNVGDTVVYSSPAKRTKNENSEKEAASATPLKSWAEPLHSRSKIMESSHVITAKNRDDKDKAIDESLSLPPEKVNWKQRQTRNRFKGIYDPFNVDLTTIQEGLSVDLRSNRARPSKKPALTKNADVVVYSCPAKARTRNKKSKTEAASAVKSWTEPRPNPRKKNHAEFTDELPRDFVEKQRAYFKEVDEFELLEEEANEYELE